jgi:hypothetical protein
MREASWPRLLLTQGERFAEPGVANLSECRPAGFLESSRRYYATADRCRHLFQPAEPAWRGPQSDLVQKFAALPPIGARQFSPVQGRPTASDDAGALSAARGAARRDPAIA